MEFSDAFKASGKKINNGDKEVYTQYQGSDMTRKQILIPDWLDVALNKISDLYDVSAGELMRVCIYMRLLENLSFSHAEIDIEFNKLQDVIKEASKSKTFHCPTHGECVEFKKFCSEAEYQCRKSLDLVGMFKQSSGGGA